ncbi:MAG: hypothetical protein ABEJ61_06965 [Haloferacaceae archaeon]
MAPVDAWTAFGVFPLGGYAYWLYTDLVRPRLRGATPTEEWDEE